jgi:hypothetical protein
MVFYCLIFFTIIGSVKECIESKPHLMSWVDLRQFYVTAEYFYAREAVLVGSNHTYWDLVPHHAQFASASDEFIRAHDMFQLVDRRV